MTIQYNAYQIFVKHVYCLNHYKIWFDTCVFQENIKDLQECFIDVLFCKVVFAWHSSQLPEQKEGLFMIWIRNSRHLIFGWINFNNLFWAFNSFLWILVQAFCKQTYSLSWQGAIRFANRYSMMQNDNLDGIICCN